MQTTAGRTYRPPFDPAAAYVAARDLKWGVSAGEEIAIPAGALFDRARLGCDEWTARRLYRTRFIAMVLDEGNRPLSVSKPSEDVPSSAPPDANLKPEEPGAEIQSAAQEMAPARTPEAGLRIKSHGFGRFTVIDQDGNRVSPEGKWLNKKEAEALLSA